MSVLTRLEATPSRVAHLLSILADRPSGETEDRLRDFCAPETLLKKDAGDPYTVFKATLGAARELGLCETVEDRIRVRPDLVKRGELAPGFLEALESALLPIEPDASPGQADFARALAWFLMQAPNRPMAFQTNYKSLIERQLQAGAPTFDLINGDRWNTFTYWCRYLGYGVAVAGRALAADPTQALRRLIPRVLKSGRAVPPAAFLGLLAEVTPVFEHGWARQEVEAFGLPSEGREDTRFSRSTSLALTRLEQEGLLRLGYSSDASGMILDLGQDSPRRISQVESLRGAA